MSKTPLEWQHFSIEGNIRNIPGKGGEND